MAELKNWKLPTFLSIGMNKWNVFIYFYFILFIYLMGWTRFICFNMDKDKNHYVEWKRKVIPCDNIYVNETYNKGEYHILFVDIYVCVRESERMKRIYIKTVMVIGSGDQKRKKIEFGWLKRILSVIFSFVKENLGIHCIILKRHTHMGNLGSKYLPIANMTKCQLTLCT